MNWTKFVPWLQGLLAAVISAAASSITAATLAPDAFNLGAQWKRTLTLAGVNGLIAGAAYLKQSPLPETKKDENEKTS